MPCQAMQIPVSYTVDCLAGVCGNMTQAALSARASSGYAVKVHVAAYYHVLCVQVQVVIYSLLCWTNIPPVLRTLLLRSPDSSWQTQ